MASVKQRVKGKGSWRAKAFLGVDEIGKQIVASKSFPTKKEGEAWAQEQEAKHRQGVYVAPSKLTVKEFGTKWLKGAAKQRLRPRTLDQYRGLLERHVYPTLGRIPLSRVSLASIDALYADLREQGLSARSIRYIHATFRTMMTSAVRGGELATNPCDHATLPRIPHSEATFLEPQQVQAFLDEVKRAGDPWWAYWLTLAHTGMRPSEGLGLQWGDLGKSTISINRTVVRHSAEGCEIKGCTHLFEDCKTKRSKRTIAIPTIVVDALNEHRKSVGSIGMAKALIFPGEHGAPPDMRTLVRLHFDPYRKAAKLPKCSPYVLRHSHISALLADGVPVAEVSQRVGHASPVMTLNTYAHVIVGGSDRLAKAIERYAQGGA